MVLSLSFFLIVNLVKEKSNKHTEPRRGLSLSKHAVLENLSICIWIMNTLKMLQIHSSDHFWNPFVTFDKATSFIPFLTKLFSLVLPCQLLTRTRTHAVETHSYGTTSSSHSSFWMECVTPFWLVMPSLECALLSGKTAEAGQRCLLLLSLSFLENTLCGGLCGFHMGVHTVHAYIAKYHIQ